MSDGITDGYREGEYWENKENFDRLKEQFIQDPNEENGRALKEAFNILTTNYETFSGWRENRAILKKFKTIDNYLEYLRSFNTIMAL